MEKTSLAIVATVGLSVFGVTGDYLLKLASRRETPLLSWWFVLGFMMYSSTAFGWVFIMRYLKLATIGVVYAMTTILLLALVGVLFLGESLRWQEVLGIVLALATIGLLARFL
jgi:drug/metabolite transporter (DMT)-like permease